MNASLMASVARLRRPLPWVVCATLWAGLASGGTGSGPEVGFDFDFAPLSESGGGARLYVAWRDAQSDVASGVLHLDDSSFDAFPTLPSGSIVNLNVGTGGPTSAQRAYVTWVGSQLELKLAVFDDAGAIVSPAEDVGNSVQISPNQLVGTDGGLLVGHIWDTNPYWDPRVLEVDISGNVLGLEVVADVSAPEQTLGTTIASEPGGSHLIAYITSDTRRVRLRRYDNFGPLDPSPVLVSDDAT